MLKARALQLTRSLPKIPVFREPVSFMRLCAIGLGLKFRRPVSFLRKYAIQASMPSILVSIFRIRLLRLSAGTNEATSLTAANLDNHLERFWPTSIQFGFVRKAFLLSLRGKIIANISQFLGRRESKLVRKNSKKLPKLFHYGFTVNFLNKNVLNALLRQPCNKVIKMK